MGHGGDETSSGNFKLGAMKLRAGKPSICVLILSWQWQSVATVSRDYSRCSDVQRMF